MKIRSFSFVFIPDTLWCQGILTVYMGFHFPPKVLYFRKAILVIILGTAVLITLTMLLLTEENAFQFIDPTINSTFKYKRPATTSTTAVNPPVNYGHHPMQKLSLHTPIDELLKLPLLERLHKVYPYHKSSEPLERTIFQIWHEQIPLTDDMRSWTSDPNFDYYLIDAPSGYRLILREFSEYFPEIVEAYNIMPKTILQYDFLRYLIVYLVGGTYSDADTYQSTPIKDWITYNETNKIGAVVGIETERDCGTCIGYPFRRVQFCQWSFQGKRHHPFYALLISNIVNVANTKYNKYTKILTFEGTDYDFKAADWSLQDSVMWFTGPAIFTDTVYEYINSLGPDIPIHNVNDQQQTRELTEFPEIKDTTWSVGKKPDVWWGWQNVTRIDQPIVVDGDFVMLPEAAFNGYMNGPGNLVEHRFQGLWKDQADQ